MSDKSCADSVLEICKNGEVIPENTLNDLMFKLIEILILESNVLVLKSPIVICGDIHGQLYDLFELFSKGGDPSDNMYLFLGDYVDRGHHSVLTFAYLAALKIKYPHNIYLLRGNHESRQVNQMYGFFSECQILYGHPGFWSLCNDVFDFLPMAAIIDNKVFSVHGGISPEIPLIAKIDSLNRFDEIPSQGQLADLVWSDPENEEPNWKKNSRGAGYVFGENQVRAFCNLNNIEFITRSHQLAMEGYQWFFNNQLITVWSAPNYMYRSGNKASIMKYNNGSYDLVKFDQCPDELRKIPSEIPTSGYFV